MSLYNPLIPTGLINLDQDYINIKNNFQQADTTFGQNHFKFSDQTANNGKHSFAQFPNRALIPPGLVNGDETIYSKAGVNPVQGELFFTRGASSVEIPMTGPFLKGTTGYAFLFGGLLLQWIPATGAAGNFAATWPFTTMSAVYSGWVGPLSTTGLPMLFSITTLTTGGITGVYSPTILTPTIYCFCMGSI